RRVDATAEAANGVLRAYLRANGFNRFLDEGGATPLGLGFADGKEKVSEDFRATVGVVDLRVKLHGVDLPLGILCGGDGVRGSPRCVEAGWEFVDMVSVAIPNFHRIGEISE